MRYLSLLLLSSVLLLPVSCSKHNIEEESKDNQEKKEEEKKEEKKIEIEIPTESAEVFSQGISFDNNSETSTISFIVTDTWTATISDTRSSSWLSVQPTGGDAGKVEMTISAPQNDSFQERESVISIRCGTMTKSFSVKQLGRPVNDVSVEEIMAGTWLTIVHNSIVFPAPLISGAKDIIIHWEDGFSEFYSPGITHTYTSEGEHSIILQTNESTGCTFRTLVGISHIDFSNY